MRKDQKTFLPVEGAFPFEGLDTMSPSTQLPPGGSPNNLNATTFRGSVRKRIGCTQLGSSLPSGGTCYQLINYQTSEGVNFLIAFTATNQYAFNGTSWTDITTTGPIIKLTKSVSNGWSVTQGSFVPGDFVAQAGTNSTGVWLPPDSTYFYIAVTAGVFDNKVAHPIGSVITNRGGGQGNFPAVLGTLTLTGTDPAGVSKTVAYFPAQVGGTGNGWYIQEGSFNVGDSVNQPQGSGVPTGIWLLPDGSYFYVQVASGTFDNTNGIANTSLGNTRIGALWNVGETGTAATTTRNFPPIHTGTIQGFYSEANYIDYAIGSDVHLGRVVVAVDGFNWPIFWDGVAANFKLLPVNLSQFCTAKAVGIQNSYLVFANIQTWVDWEPRSAAWSDTGNFQEWLVGNSGILTEMQFDGEILRLIPYNGNLVVFSRNTIGCMCYISSDVIFGTQIYVNNINIVGPRAISFLNPFMIYAAQDNLYVWDGGRAVSPLADRIALTWRQSVNYEYINRTKLLWDPTLNQVRFVIPTGATTDRTLVVEAAITSATFYDIQKSSRTRWFEHHYANRITCFALYNTDNKSSTVNVLNPAFGSDNGIVMVQQGTETNDGTSLVPLVWDTGDLVTPQIYQSQIARWIELEFEASGTSVTTFYSLDQGQTWSQIQTSQLTGERLAYKHFFDATGRFLRLRFFVNADSSTFELSWYRIWLRPGGVR